MITKFAQNLGSDVKLRADFWILLGSTSIFPNACDRDGDTRRPPTFDATHTSNFRGLGKNQPAETDHRSTNDLHRRSLAERPGQRPCRMMKGTRRELCDGQTLASRGRWLVERQAADCRGTRWTWTITLTGALWSG